MPAIVWMQATAVTQETTVTPASSNSKDDSNHVRSQQQERKQQQEWQQQQDRQNSMDAIKIGGIAATWLGLQETPSFCEGRATVFPEKKYINGIFVAV